ncbi:DUF5687 family protein [Fodinibius halophilus]|uniref:Uncharacterized protein n=1 Tax=Fodinibius halophilus TaxID=1736908 RepID=A0A6M1TER1_9BACT|nr:DUF5687 family protein [Fodinibius halophilus]NGP87130.1 hypothetical protein [Fodinibius halophilus]
MYFTFLKLRFLKAVRSVTLSRDLVTGVFLFFIGFVLLVNILVVGFSMEMLAEEFGYQNNISGFINTYLIFYFFTEIIYRYFLQKISPVDLANYLHLPIGRPSIIHFVLSNSFISALNIVPLLLFGPIAVSHFSGAFGTSGAVSWLLAVLLISWAIHWFVLFFKQKYGESSMGLLLMATVFISSTAGFYFGWFNIGKWVAPFYDLALTSWIPCGIIFFMAVLLYYKTFRYYLNNAYIEELSKEKDSRYFTSSISAFDRFGIAGKMADVELKLILRHKRPRVMLALSPLFLLYGLIFYGDMDFGEGIPGMTIFVGIFITGIFIMNYGQYFLSWNSAYFDFFSSNYKGVEALVTGKYILFGVISLICFVLSLPYVYYGWKVVLVNGATFLFNMGVTVNCIVFLALMKPKPIDLNKRAMFNYEGMGAAQFLMIIPMLILPYLIYLPFAFMVNDMAGVAALATTGVIGIFFHEKFIQLQVNKILKNQYKIGSSFRQEL